MQGSPVELSLFQMVEIDRSSTTAVYVQIAQQIIRFIQNGTLSQASRLPGTRPLALLWGIHRKTVVAAWEELAQLGWIEQRPNKGTFILHPSSRITALLPVRSTKKATTDLGFDFVPSIILENPFPASEEKGIVLNDGQPDERLAQWQGFYARYHSVTKRNLGKWKTEWNQFSEQQLHQQLRTFLQISRGLLIPTGGLTTTRTMELALYTVIQFLIRPGEVVVVGKWSYYQANMLLTQAGAKLLPLPVDENGLDVEALEIALLSQPIRAVYVNPQGHFPTTVALSAARRLRLIELAKQYRFVILEDETENEMQYESGVQLPLFSESNQGNVIYLGGMGKTLWSTLQTGWILAHPQVIQELEKYKQLVDRHADHLLQQTLAELIDEGDWFRFYKKAVHVYRERRDFVVNWINQHASDLWTVEKPTHGLAIWVEWKKPVSLEKWRLVNQAQGMHLPRGLLYQNQQTTAFRLGFGQWTTSEMELVLAQLAQTARSLTS